jgi:hypothetical protein
MVNVTDPTREVVHGDAIAWLEAHPKLPGASVIASIPDVSEIGLAMAPWREFFALAVRRALEATPDDGVTFFFQTDLKIDGRWLSKASIVLREAEALDVPLLWHKVVCRRPAGDIQRGRPGYSHLLAFSRTVLDSANSPTADVLPDRGFMAWSHGMGSRSAELSVGFVKAFAPATRVIVAPFCGTGTALAVANRMGYDAIGIERNRKRAEAARALTLDGSESSDVD